MDYFIHRSLKKSLLVFFISIPIFYLAHYIWRSRINWFDFFALCFVTVMGILILIASFNHLLKKNKPYISLKTNGIILPNIGFIEWDKITNVYFTTIGTFNTFLSFDIINNYDPYKNKSKIEKWARRIDTKLDFPRILISLTPLDEKKDDILKKINEYWLAYKDRS